MGKLWILILFSSFAAAQNQYYVNTTTGSDSFTATQAQNPSTPWKTIGHVDGNVTIGASGTIVHVAAGTYTASLTCANNGVNAVVCTNQGGASLSRRLTFQCDAPALLSMLGSTTQGCIIKQTPSTAVVQAAWSLEGVTGGANFVDIIGFHFATNAASHAAIVGFCNDTGLAAGAQCPNINSVHAIGNLIEPMGQTLFNSANCAANGNSFGAGIDLNDKHGHWVSDAQVVGNMIAPYGNSGVCKFGYSVYANGKNQIIQKNIMWGAPIGLHVYDEGCGYIISNNLIIDSGDYGMIVWNTGDFAGDAVACNPTGLNTIINNAIINTGVGWAHLLSDSGSGMQLRSECDSTHRTLVKGNLMSGNTHADFIGYQGAAIDSCADISGTVTEPTTATFTNFQNNGTGDYHLKAASLAVAGGASSCVSGGTTPCVPTSDIENTAMSSPPPIGPLTFTASGTPIPHVAPAPSSFPSTNVGVCSIGQTFTVSNSGNASLTLNANQSITGANLTEFQFGGGTGPTCSTGTVLAPGGSCVDHLQFCPLSAGSKAAQLNIPTSAGAVTAALSGTGIQSDATIAASTGGGTLAFGSQAVNTVSGTLQGILTSSGTGPLTVTAISASAPYVLFSDTCPRSPATMTPGQTCQINVEFNPLLAGSQPGTLTVTSNAISPQTLALTGTGVSSGNNGIVITPPVLINGGVVLNPQ